MPMITTSVSIPDDGAQLPARLWLPQGPAPGRPKAIIVGLHGFNDYSAAFEPVAESLSAAGYGVLAFDQRGFGLNADKGAWVGTERMVADALQAVRQAHKQFPDIPVYIMGESMGGAVGVLVAAKHHADLQQMGVAGLILSAPAVWEGGLESDAKRTALSAFGKVASWLRLPDPPPFLRLATDNVALMNARLKDPHVILWPRMEAMHGIAELAREASNNLGWLKLPVLVAYGNNDHVLPGDAMLQARVVFRERAAAGAPVRRLFYPNGYHLLFRDLQAPVFLADIVAWLGNKQAPLPSGCEETMVKPPSLFRRRPALPNKPPKP